MAGRYQAYPEYKDSGVEWLGRVPAHWKTSCLRWYINIASGEGLSNTEFDKLPDETNIFPVIGGNGTLGYSAYLNTISKVFAIGRVGALCGNVYFINEKCWITDNALKLSAWRAFQDGYLFFLLTAARLNEYASKNAQPLITGEQVKALQVVMPSIDEQQQIANFLNNETAKIDTLIEKQQQLIKLLKEKRQAVISHAVTKGLNPDAPMKESGVEWLGEVSEHWEITKIGYLSQKTGSGKTPKGGSEVYSDSGILFLRSQNVHNTGLRVDKNEVVFISEKIDAEMAGSRVKGGDILLNITGASIGRTCIVPDDFQQANVNQHVCIIRVPVFLQKYVSLYLKSAAAKAQIDAVQNGAAREGLNFEQLSSIFISLPKDVRERESIANFLDHETAKIDTLIEKAYNAIELMQERRTALISAAVTGKIDVRNWQAPEQNQTNEENAAYEPKMQDGQSEACPSNGLWHDENDGKALAPIERDVME